MVAVASIELSPRLTRLAGMARNKGDLGALKGFLVRGFLNGFVTLDSHLGKLLASPVYTQEVEAQIVGLKAKDQRPNVRLAILLKRGKQIFQEAFERAWRIRMAECLHTWGWTQDQANELAWMHNFQQAKAAVEVAHLFKELGYTKSYWLMEDRQREGRLVDFVNLAGSVHLSTREAYMVLQVVGLNTPFQNSMKLGLPLAVSQYLKQ
ncbi:hypothetical protein C5B42_03835 [Candidatus Cerribacteria bacterium 'Amazon FNV 2010 28 9']|uniref:Uncharacterized protein n=1 Tax=Candidatus Cerribacteria bacterium 'Amazon FNV 2010 28 9' TaxID=2081795 RepID=A0A317JNS4_9BACT|nr:MAG: hypothetical protein C5B42_03835 [Candidatus Cerribacteria bacterium 'Amazon FNV 2010 28 9']